MPAPQSNRYDVVIAGASFGGLAAARALRGRVLLLDRQPVGDGVTSACAAPLTTVRAMGAEASIVQVHTALMIHTPAGSRPAREPAGSRPACDPPGSAEGSRPAGSVTWPLPEPFCTFDYRAFCQAAAAGAGADFELASVRGREGRRVLTSTGSVEGRVLIDATGPRAALAGRHGRRYMAFGLESEVGFRMDPGLHFYFVPEIRDGYAWAFPCGATTRFGVISYRGRTKLLPALIRFTRRFGEVPGHVHGGYLATGWTAGSAGDVFVVGDAAGLCLPVSGEGIRTAVLAGDYCGRLVQRVLDGSMSEGEARAAYTAFIRAERARYRGLLAANALLLGWPQHALARPARVLARPRASRWFFGHYLGIFGRPATGIAPVSDGRRPASDSPLS